MWANGSITPCLSSTGADADFSILMWCFGVVGWWKHQRNGCFCGDTGYSNDFKEIGKRFPPMDLSLIPIGAYAPRWFMKDMHCNPEEAVQIHLDVKSQKSIGMHWGTFMILLTNRLRNHRSNLLKY